jgi:hypothetical protein
MITFCKALIVLPRCAVNVKAESEVVTQQEEEDDVEGRKILPTIINMNIQDPTKKCEWQEGGTRV